jgi:hypothetical protein
MIYINPIGEAERNCMGMSGLSLLFMDKSVWASQYSASEFNKIHSWFQYPFEIWVASPNVYAENVWRLEQSMLHSGKR